MSEMNYEKLVSQPAKDQRKGVPSLATAPTKAQGHGIPGKRKQFNFTTVKGKGERLKGRGKTRI